MTRPVALHAVRTKWLRVKSEVAYVRMLFAGARFRESLERDEQLKAYAETSQKYSPDQPRVPAGSSEGGQWTDGGGGTLGESGLGDIHGGGGDDKLDQIYDPTKYSVKLVKEDARGGHAVRDHVAKSDADLLGVVERSVIRTPGHTF